MKWILTAVLLLATFGAAWAETKEEEAARYIETLVASIEEGNDPMRNRMFIKLRYIGTPSIEPLLGSLGSDSPDVRRYVAFTLGFFDDPAVVDPLIGVFENDKEVAVRCAAAEALGRLECAEAVDLLIAALAEPEAQVRQSAAYSLGLIGDARARPALEKAQSDDEDELVRFFAGDALEWIDRAEARKTGS